MPSVCQTSPDENAIPVKLNRGKLYVTDGKFVSTGGDVARTATRYRLKRIPIILRIENWVMYKSDNECICDSCIAKEIGFKDVKKVALATRKLALRESRFFTRWRGECSSCGKYRIVILARRLTWA